MGGCVSRPGEGCAGGRLRHPRLPRRRTRRAAAAARWRVSPRGAVSTETVAEAEGPSDNGCPAAVDGGGRRTYGNPTFHGSKEEAWFDTTITLESDCDDDFLSVQDDAMSLNGVEATSVSGIPSFRDANSEDNANLISTSCSDQQQNSSKVMVVAIRNSSNGVNSQENGATADAKTLVNNNRTSSVYADEIVTGDEGGLLAHCGILPNNCLPCLVPTASTVDKKASLSSSPPGSRKKTALKLSLNSFKWKSGEGHLPNSLFNVKTFLERPIAGSQVPFCLLEKKMPDCWSHIEPCTFKVRGENYFRDKKKDFASNHAAYHPYGMDVFLCQQKINHISRFVKLPNMNSSGEFPYNLVVNVQVPLYPATIFQSDTNGEGMCFVLYFRLSDNFLNEFPSHFQENLRKFIDDEVEKVKSFPVDTNLPVRERLKILGRVVNIEDLHLSAAERKLMHAYNEKPVLSRPQHEFYLGDDYFEIDIDMHRFSYLSRKGFEAFLDRLKICILDIGLTIQGNRPEELPERILCCIRLNKINYTNYHQLAVTYT